MIEWKKAATMVGPPKQISDAPYRWKSCKLSRMYKMVARQAHILGWDTGVMPPTFKILIAEGCQYRLP